MDILKKQDFELHQNKYELIYETLKKIKAKTLKYEEKSNITF